MRAKLIRLIFIVFFVSTCYSVQANDNTAATLDKAIAGAHRSSENKARDKYRHPKETLLFFGVQPNMHVVEVWPGRGWYTEILAPLLRDGGKLYAATFSLQAKDRPAGFAKVNEAYTAMLKATPGVYDRVVVTQLDAPQFVDMAPKGSVDLVLTFRNVHNWAKYGNAQAMFKAFYNVLKPGGVLGVVDHRAKEGTSLADMIRSGYVTESYVIQLAQEAGFKLADKSEINANPKDTKNYSSGVWTLPPTLTLGDKDREKYLAIGESDRMTLKFVKPVQ